MWINIEQSDGTKYGDGPITTATSWVSRPRLDKPGKFSFRCSVGERQAAEIVAKRHVHCYGIVNGAVAELGVGGVIDQIETVIAGSGAPYLLVSGDDLLRDLRRHQVGDLELYDVDGSYSTPNNAYYHYALGEIDDYMTDALDGNAGTHHRVAVDDKGFIYVGHETRFTTILFVLGGITNNNAATLEGQYYSDVTGWSDVSNLADGTLNGGNQTWNQTGDVTFDRPSDWAPTVHDEKEQYWVRIDPTSTTDSIDFSEIQIKAEVPSTTPIADIMAFAPAGWSVEDEAAGANPEPSNLPRLQFSGESVLTALQKLAEDSGEHFRLGSGKTLVWIQSTVASDIRAIGAHGADSVSLDGNAAICLIESLRKSEDHYEVATRVYPYGAGRGIGRVTLANATDSKAGYTIDTANNYIKVDTEAAGTREDRVMKFPEVGTEYDDALQSEQASNDLLTAAHEWLSRHIAAQNAYRVSVLKLDGAVEPGETLDVFYQEYRGSTKVVDIDATLHILEATHEVNTEGIRTTALYLGSIDTWPQSGGDVVAGLSHRVARLESGDEATAAIRIYQQVEVLELEDAPFVVLAATPSFTNERVLTPGDGLAGTDGGAGSTYTMAVDVSDFAGTGIEDDGSENLRIAAAAAGDGLQGGAGSALAVDVSDFAGTGLEGDGSENLRIAAAAAGAGLTGGAGSALAVNPGTSLEISGDTIRLAAVAGGAGLIGGGPVALAAGAGTGITVNANDVAVNLGYAFTWTAKHIFRSTTTPQVEIGYDAAAYISISQTDGGDVTLATVSDGNGDIIAAPAGNWIFDPVGDDVLPQTNYDINLGSMLKKYHTLWAAELNVGVLVARETMAIFGGRALIGPSTTVLIEDIATDETNWRVEHNAWASGDMLYLEGVGKVEFVQVTHWNLVDVSAANDWFKLAGDMRGWFAVGQKFTIAGSTGNDGEWTIASTSYSDPNTTLNVDEDVTDATVDGYVLYRGAQSGEDFAYAVVRDKDGSGANLWYAGDAVFNTGSAGDGHIDMYAVRGVKASTEYGPTIVGNVRNSATYNDWTPHWAIGELNGIYGYGATTYGAAFGKYGDDWITVENTNGIRIYANNILVGQWLTNADLILGQVATDKANLFWDQSAGRLNFRGGSDGIAVMAYVDTDGSIYAADGHTWLDENGLNLDANPGVDLLPIEDYSITWWDGAAVEARMGGNSAGVFSMITPHEFMFHIGTAGSYVSPLLMFATLLRPDTDKTYDFGHADYAWDDAYADDWNNVADFYSMDRRRRDEDGRIVDVDDLAILRGILASGNFDERTGLELIDDSTLPEWLLTRAKEAVDGKREVLRDSEGKPYLSMRMVLSLLMGAARQTDARLSALESPGIS